MISGRIAVPIIENNNYQENPAENKLNYDAYELFDLEDGKVKSTSILKTEKNNLKDCLIPVSLLSDNDVTSLIIRKIDMRSYIGFRSKGIEVYQDKMNKDNKFVIDELISGRLDPITERQICGGKRRYTV